MDIFMGLCRMNVQRTLEDAPTPEPEVNTLTEAGAVSKDFWYLSMLALAA